MGDSITPAVVVHGGAGFIHPDRYESARQGCERAARAGLTVLAGGGSALDAAQAAVRVLEDDPAFNAGVGAVLTRAGAAEMDAAVMDGRDLRVGAVAAMANARQPIDIARAVLDDGEHILLCAEGAWAFARERGFTPCDPAEIITERSRERLEEARRRAGHTVREVDPELHDPGTVGACAVDAAGHVAAATSTGGMTFKRTGRIGDTPLPGAGTYADDRGGAASATGEGEAIIRVTMTRTCVELMRSGLPARTAAWASADELADRVGGSGGIICVDARGRIGLAHNSETMSWAAGTLDRSELRVTSGVRAERDQNL
jgi:L-asparaginase / beta-aspartyl-peptidase